MSNKLASFDKSIAALNTKLAAIDKSREEVVAKLAAVTVEREAFEAANAGLQAIEAGLPNGTKVVFNYGRKEVKQLEGEVLGTKPQDKGPTLYRITTGEGFDQQVVTVFATAIVSHNFVAQASDSTDPLAGVDGNADAS